MARFKMNYGSTKVWLSAKDTYNWATRPRKIWPCSQLANRTVYAEFAANGDLADLVIDGGRGDQDCNVNEFNAIMEDFITLKYGDGHPTQVWWHVPKSAGYR